MRQQPALQRPLARPHDVGDEVLEAELGELGPDPGVVIGRSPVRTSSSFTLRRAARSSSSLTSSRLVQVRLMGRERAVLAVAAARPRQRQRDVAREGDPATHGASLRMRRHPRPLASCRPVRPSRRPPAARRRCSPRAAAAAGGDRDRPPTQRRDAAARLRAQRRHAGIYAATERGLTRPRASTCASRRRAPRPTRVKLLLGGRADLAILDIHDLAIAREQRRATSSASWRSSSARSRRCSPSRRSAGRATSRARRVGVTGLPSRRRRAALDRRGRRRRPRQGRTTTIGFNAVPALLARPGRRGHGVLERRGRRAAARRRPGAARVPRRRLRRARLPRARPGGDAPDAASSAAAGAPRGPRARSAATAPSQRRPGRALSAMPTADPALDPAASRRSSTPSPRRSRRARRR